MILSRMSLTLLALLNISCASAVDRPVTPSAAVPTDRFAALDRDHDGVISRAEFAAGMPDDGTDAPRRAAGGDQPGRQPGRPPAPEELFKDLDHDHDGALGRAEFVSGMQDLARRRGPADGAQGRRPPPPPREDDQGPGGERGRPDDQGDDRRGPPPDQRGRPGERDDDDRRGPPADERGADRRGPPPDERGPRDDRRGPPPDDRGRPDDRQGPPPGRGQGDDRGPRDDRRGPPDAAERGKRLDQAFTAADADGNGTLSPAEFTAALHALPRPPRPPPGDRRGD